MFELTRNRGAWGHLLEWRDRAGRRVTTREIVETRTSPNWNTLIWMGFSGHRCRIDWKFASPWDSETSIRIGPSLIATQKWNDEPFWPTRVHTVTWQVRGPRMQSEITKRSVVCPAVQVHYRSSSRLLGASVTGQERSRFVVGRRLPLGWVDLMCGIVVVQCLSTTMYPSE